MRIACPACKLDIGDTTTHTVQQAVNEHICLASDEDHLVAVTEMRFLEIIREQGL